MAELSRGFFRLTNLKAKSPKHEARFKYHADMDEVFEKSKKAGLLPQKVGGRPAKSGEDPECQVRILIRDPPATVLISRSKVQITYSSSDDKDLWESIRFLEEQKILPGLSEGFYYVSTTPTEAMLMKRTILDQWLRIGLLKGEREKVNELIMGLIGSLGHEDEIVDLVHEFLNNYSALQKLTDKKFEEAQTNASAINAD
jgi:hypothetical protein